jgi:hypothetical protein
MYRLGLGVEDARSRGPWAVALGGAWAHGGAGTRSNLHSATFRAG